MLKDAVWRTAYLKRLFEVMENYLSTGWLQAQVAQIYGQIKDTAREDNAKWGAGDIDVGVKALLVQLSIRKAQLYSDPIFTPYAIAEAGRRSADKPPQPTQPPLGGLSPLLLPSGAAGVHVQAAAPGPAAGRAAPGPSSVTSAAPEDTALDSDADSNESSR